MKAPRGDEGLVYERMFVLSLEGRVSAPRMVDATCAGAHHEATGRSSALGLAANLFPIPQPYPSSLPPQLPRRIHLAS
jgi:hypothetical protein